MGALTTNSKYIEQRDGGYDVAGRRISLDSVVYAFNREASPERILEQFPLLLRQASVYGAIAFDLDHKLDIDRYLECPGRYGRPPGLSVMLWSISDMDELRDPVYHLPWLTRHVFPR